MKRFTKWFALVRFSHSIFALPFALQGAWLAAGGTPTLRTLLLVVACAVCARTAAMGFNRLADARIDAQNPRTRSREIPAGQLTRSAVAVLVLCASLLFVASAWALNPLSGKLALPVLGVLLGYSYVKRFHWAAHLVLGLALALAPLGAWIAVRGDFSGPLAPVLWLAGAVLTWVAGFDLIYACQDAEFDRNTGLHSVPQRFGVANALRLARVLHVFTVLALSMVALCVPSSWVYALAIVLAAALLAWEHSLVAPDDLSRVNLAFFTINGWVGVGLFAGLVLDCAWRGGRA